ncbi:MAG: TonB-dependent receptor [Candidatus Marinimicrobia bacterium]|nr:TonB-dependent receptor [Candidatus Neomarinimicrobiota bacterium]
MKKCLPILILLLSVTAFTQNVSVSGFVREDATGEPLSYVNVFLKGTYWGAATRQDGYYVIPSVPPGKYELMVSIIGYEDATRSIIVAAGKNLRVDFRLKVSPITGETVTVTAERMKFKEKMELSTINLTMREIKVAPGFIEADVFRAIQLLPGVQSLNDFSSALYVRGSTPDQNLIMLDGITVYNPFHLGGVFSTFNTDAIKEAEFSAGGFSARHGGRMGSILNIINREGNTEEYTGKANISIISSKALIEGPIPKWTKLKGSWMLAGRRTYFDKIVNGILYFVKKNAEKNDPYYDENDYVGFPYYFYDLEGKINIDLGNNHRLTLSSFYGDDVLHFDFEDEYSHDDPQESYYDENKDEGALDWRWGNRTNSLTWRWIVSPKLIVKTFLAESRFRFRINMDDKSEGVYIFEGDTSKWRNEYNFDVFDVVKDKTVESEITWIPNNKHTITTGLQHKQLDFNLGMTFKWGELEEEKFVTHKDTALWMLDKPFEQSLYFQDKWHINPLFSTQLGLRVSRYSLHNKIYLEPRIGLKYLLQDNLALKFSWGKYHQFLTTANPQDENFRFIDIWLAIPKDRPASRAHHTILGIEYLSTQDILFRVETYYKDFGNLITLKQGDMFAEEEGEIRFDPFNEFWDTDAYAYGLEFLAKKTTGKVQGWIGYTYAVTKRKTEVQPWYFPKYDRAHTLNIVGDWQWTKRIHLSSAVSYSTGNPYTPILGRYEKWEEDNWSNMSSWWLNKRYLVGKKNSARYPSYFRWDASLIHRKPIRIGYREWYLQIINITNHMNTLMYFYEEKYDYKTDRSKGVRRFGVPMFPFIPTLGIRFEF